MGGRVCIVHYTEIIYHYTWLSLWFFLQMMRLKLILMVHQIFRHRAIKMTKIRFLWTLKVNNKTYESILCVSYHSVILSFVDTHLFLLFSNKFPPNNLKTLLFLNLISKKNQSSVTTLHGRMRKRSLGVRRETTRFRRFSLALCPSLMHTFIVLILFSVSLNTRDKFRYHSNTPN